MNSRQIAFLRLLLEHEEYLPVSFYAGKMDVSDKTLRRMIPGVNEILMSYNGAVESRPGTGIKLEVNEEERGRLMNSAFMMELMDSGALSGSWNQLSRRMDIALNLLLYSDETTSLSGLAYKYYVSKSSIAGDLKALVPFAGKHELRIAQGHGGTSVEGTESCLRKALAELLLYILDNNINVNAGGGPAAAGMFESDTLMTILDIFTEEDLNFVEGLIKHIETSAGYRFDELEYMEFSVNLLVMIYRVRNGFFMEPILKSNYRKQDGDPLAAMAFELASRLSGSYRYTLSVSETSHIYNILAATHLGNFLLQKELPEEESRKTAVAFGEDFIDAFSVITGINLRTKSTFYVNVVSHITLMLNRAASSTPARNPIIDILLDNYKGTINVCQIICRILTEKFRLPEISFDEICYLMLYIQGELLADEEKMNVILVSNMSNSITNILKHKLSQNYPQWSVLSCDYNRFLNMSQKQYDLILSTVPLGSGEHVIPYALVSPLLDEKDCTVVNNLLKSCRHREDLYLRELIRTRNDLYDIGCTIEVRNRKPTEIPVTGLLKVTALKEVEFVYIHNEAGINRCEFVTDLCRKKLDKVIMDMSNWDFMLFASKMVYLMDNCPDWAMTEFIQNIITEGR